VTIGPHVIAQYVIVPKHVLRQLGGSSFPRQHPHEEGKQARICWRYGNSTSADRQLTASTGFNARTVTLDRTMRRETALEQPGDRASRSVSSASDTASSRLGAHDPATPSTDDTTAVVTVPVFSLRPADSPRLNGEDKAHLARLAETETPLPPILVDKRTMRVIDGMHRLMAASLQGRETIDVVFFDGSDAEIFLRAVQENIAHGLPLSQGDRRAAAERIIASHPHMSDRAICSSVGIAAKTVAAIRKRSGEEGPQSNARVGRDGRIRPLNSGEGRRRAAELLAQQPEASLRDVARAAGISPATVLDVRKRLERGEPAVPGKHPASSRTSRADANADGDESPASTTRFSPTPSRSAASRDAVSAVEKLLRDPSLRSSDRGKGMLWLLHVNAVAADQLTDFAAAVPPHCVAIVVQLACQYANMWQDFAAELDGRARIIDPSAAMTLNRRSAPGASISGSPSNTDACGKMLPPPSNAAIKP
jgi:ParB-like chromosome segregation protein Spo0J